MTAAELKAAQEKYRQERFDADAAKALAKFVKDVGAPKDPRVRR